MSTHHETAQRIRPGFVLSLLVLCGSLVGCMAAPAVFSAMTFGFGGYTQYQMAFGGEASFEIERRDPSPAARDEIRESKSLVFPPGLDWNAGRTVDVFRDRTDMSVVSSTKTTAWLKEKGLEDFSYLPSDERREALRRLAQAHEADLALMVEDSGNSEASGAALLGNYTITSKFTTTIISGRTGNVLWTEKHQLSVTQGPRRPHPSEVREIIAMGVADRLMEIRTGQRRTVAEKDGGLIACGELLNFTCDQESEAAE